MTLEELRSYFPNTAHSVYLNHAATGPLSVPVVQAVQSYLEDRHTTNVENFVDFQPTLISARRRIADLLNAPLDRVEFVQNTSHGLNILAQGFPWKEGDRIAVPCCEFPANVYPFLNLERRGVKVDFIPTDGGVVDLADVRRTLRPETRLLSISWVQYLSGYRVDLAEIGALCRDRDVLFCVDAIQGAGALTLDVLSAGVDFLSSGGHKWIMATQGIGFIYLTEELQEMIAPAAGWLHGPVDWERLDEYELAFHDDAARFRLGTTNNVGITALNAALELRERAGGLWCEKSVLARARQLAEGLSELGLDRYGSSNPTHDSGIVSIEHPRVEALFDHLTEDGIRTAVRQKKLRFSPTYYNSASEIVRALESVEAFVKTT